MKSSYCKDYWKILAIVTLLLTAGAVSATTYYVRPDGHNESCNGLFNDSVASAPNCAWKNISRAFNTSGAEAGSIIRIQNGTYSNETVVMEELPNSTYPIVIIGDNNPIMAGNDTNNYTAFTFYRIGRLKNISDISISGLTIQKYKYGIYAKTDTGKYWLRNISISNLTLSNMGSAAIYAQKGSPTNGDELSNFTIRNNDISNFKTSAIDATTLNFSVITQNNIHDANVSTAPSYAIGYIISNSVISYNTIKNISITGSITIHGISISANQYNITIINNYIQNYTGRAIRKDNSETILYPGVQIWIENNTIIDSQPNGFDFYSANIMYIKNNTLINTTATLLNKNSTFINNKFINSTVDVIWGGITFQPPDNNIFQNNIFYGLTTNLTIQNCTCSFKNNIFNFTNNKGIVNNTASLGAYPVNGSYNFEYGRFSLSGITNWTSNLTGNPLFANTTSGYYDFHLRSAYGRWNGTAWVKDTETSPAIGAGDPTSDNSLSPWGGVIEMGAYGNTPEASQGQSSLLDCTTNFCIGVNYRFFTNGSRINIDNAAGTTISGLGASAS